MSTPDHQQQIERNVRVHDRIAERYERTHGEIFNPVEQERLRASLERAGAAIQSHASPRRALDFGCGSGNLTRHLLALGYEVVAADVSPVFLDMIERRYAGDPVRTYRMDGRTLGGLDDECFDLVAAYSVLHHVPDYLAAVAEMARVTRRGGVVYIDHEHSPGYWDADPGYRAFVRKATRFDWGKYFVPDNYYGKLRRLLIDPRYSNEGDIHVWPDDHIEWDEVEARLRDSGFERLFAEDYLVCRNSYRTEIYEAHRGRFADMRVLAMRKGR